MINPKWRYSAIAGSSRLPLPLLWLWLKYLGCQHHAVKRIAEIMRRNSDRCALLYAFVCTSDYGFDQLNVQLFTRSSFRTLTINLYHCHWSIEWNIFDRDLLHDVRLGLPHPNLFSILNMFTLAWLCPSSRPVCTTCKVTLRCVWGATDLILWTCNKPHCVSACVL